MDEDFREGVANVTSFAKQKKCWGKIKDMPYKLSIPSIDLLNREEIEDVNYDKKMTSKAGKQIDAFNQVMGINQNEWVELSDYLRNEENLPFQHTSVQIVQKCVQMHHTGKPVTQRQAVAALKILEDAIERDFNYVR